MEGKEKRLYLVILCLGLVLAGLSGYVASNAVTSSVASVSPNTSDSSNVHTITVSGSGTASMKATLFSTYVGVETQANTTIDAVSQNAERMSSVVSALRALGLTDDEMQTSQFSVSSVYKRVNPWDVGELVGFRVVNDITITSNKTDQIGKIIDTAVAGGANRVGDITFTLPDEKIKALKVEAMQNAAEDAKLRATTYATTLGTSILGVVSISEPSYSSYFTAARVTLSVTPSSETPILIGNASVSVSITVVFMIV
jgi:uncharacterized protein YggE